MVRTATLNDVPDIAELYREQFREMSDLIPAFIKEGDQSIDFIEKTISEEMSDILLYEDNGRIVGFVLIQAKERPDFQFIVPGRFCYIMDIIVTKKSRNKGFGTALMSAVKDWAVEKECNFINLDVLSNNTGAIELYKKLGFIPKAQEMYLNLK